MRLTLIIFILGTVALFGFFVYRSSYRALQCPLNSLTEDTLSFKNTVLRVLVADNGIERQCGLSGRDTLSPHDAMLFVFSKSDKHGIWMKNMIFSIDIMWMDETGKVVYMKENILPSTFPEIFKPEESALYVLEAPAGFIEEMNIQVNDIVGL